MDWLIAIEPSRLTDPTVLATFPTPLARAVVAVLTDSGVPAALAEQAGEPAVVVPRTRRQEAFNVLSARMEEVQEHAAGAASAAAAPTDAADEPPPRPLVMERFRDMGFVAIALIPLLVVTLSNVRLPGAYVAAIVIGGMVGLVAWRNGRRAAEADEDDPG